MRHTKITRAGSTKTCSVHTPSTHLPTALCSLTSATGAPFLTNIIASNVCAESTLAPLGAIDLIHKLPVQGRLPSVVYPDLARLRHQHVIAVTRDLPAVPAYLEAMCVCVCACALTCLFLLAPATREVASDCGIHCTHIYSAALPPALLPPSCSRIVGASVHTRL